MWTPRWVKYIVGAIRTESGATQEAIKKQEDASREAEKASETKEREIAGIIASAIRTSHEEVPTYEKTQRAKEYGQQGKLMWAAWFTFGAAFAYGAVAAWQGILMHSTYGQIRAQTIAAQKAAYKSCVAASAAGDTVNNSIQQFRVDERAWVEIEPIKPTLLAPEDATFPASFTYGVYLKNVGKTIARDVRLRAPREAILSAWGLGDNRNEIEWQQDNLLRGKVPSASDLPINDPVDRTLAPNTVSAVPFQFHGQGPKNGGYSYVIGRIDYVDAFGETHWKKFCFVVANRRGELWNCRYGNDEDNNPEPSPPRAPLKCVAPN